jgi:hypothetical protein
MYKWDVSGMCVDLWCNAYKRIMEYMWGVNATKVVVSYMPRWNFNEFCMEYYKVWT